MRREAEWVASSIAIENTGMGHPKENGAFYIEEVDLSKEEWGHVHLTVGYVEM